MSPRQNEPLCPHGLVGFCPDCPPDRIDTTADVTGAPTARVKGRTVWRTKMDGSLDWVTNHLTKRGARRAADLYERTGRVKGFRP